MKTEKPPYYPKAVLKAQLHELAADRAELLETLTIIRHTLLNTDSAVIRRIDDVMEKMTRKDKDEA